MAAKLEQNALIELFVSTHSHPKVAAQPNGLPLLSGKSFNTQPPEGGCALEAQAYDQALEFQHTATRRWLHKHIAILEAAKLFQHTATRRWLLEDI